MSAAYYLARLGYNVTVFEAMPVPGGMMAIGIPEYRLPRTVLREEIDRIVGLGVELKLDSAMGRDFTLADLEAKYQAVFLATGASRSRKLGVPGDDLPGVIPATLFLKQVNLGEKPVLRGAVVVVGGGSTAMDAARSALRSGASSVTVLYRRGRAEMPAQAEEVEAAEHEGVHVQFEAAVTEVEGSEKGVTCVKYVSQRPTGQVRGRTGRVRADPRQRPRDRRRHGARGRRRGARSVDPAGRAPASRRAASPASSRTPARPPAARASSPAATSCRAPRRSSMPSGPAAAPPARSTSTCPGSRDGEAEIMATVRVPKGPEPVLTVDLATRPRVGMAAAGLQARLVRGHAARPRAGRGHGRSDALLPLRRRLPLRAGPRPIRARARGTRPLGAPIGHVTVAQRSPQLAAPAGNPGSISGGRD